MTKVISISDDAYARLKSLKDEGDSFTDVVIELTEEKKGGSIMDLAGAWKDIPEMDTIFKEILKNRHKVKLRDVKLN